MMMEDEAKRAIMELNGCMLNGNRLNVEVRDHHVCIRRIWLYSGVLVFSYFTVRVEKAEEYSWQWSNKARRGRT